jgi:diguanylate cyclase (GGDEF)-like protein
MSIEDILKKNLRPEKDDRGHFNLLRYFTISSVGIFILGAVILGAVFVSLERGMLVDYALFSTKQFAYQLSHRIFDEGLLNVSDQSVGVQVKQGSPEFNALDRMISAYISGSSDILKVKIFDKHGRVIYSTDERNIGIYSSHERLMKALSGGESYKLTNRMKPLIGEMTEAGRLYSVDLLEVYVPMYDTDGFDTDGRKVIGAFEIYKDVSAVFGRARRAGIMLFGLATLVMLLLFLVLFMVVRKADCIIRERTEEISRYNRELEEAQLVITRSIDEVIEHGSFHVRYTNNKLIKCWEHKKCEKTDCPSYKSDNLRCWQVAGTFCGDKVQGYFASKYGDCRKCDVFKNAFRDRISTIGESFNNMMALLQSKHSQLIALNEKLNRMIDTDPLTQVGNRRSFQKRMDNIHLMSLRYKRTYSIIMCDIDEFKLYNDTYGHQQGDYALIKVAKTIRKNLRKTDEVFRWGGEEFVIVLPEQGLEAAIKVAENLRTRIQALTIDHSGSRFRVMTASFGVASNTTENINFISWENVLKMADDELYRAKTAGKNRVYPELKSAGGGRGTA